MVKPAGVAHRPCKVAQPAVRSGNQGMDMFAGNAGSASDPWRHEEFERVTIRAHIVHDTGVADRRVAPRLPVDIDATVRELGATGNEARVINISETGFMAETTAEFEIGARIWLLLPGRERANAVVRWTAPGKLGAEFAEPVQPEQLISK